MTHVSLQELIFRLGSGAFDVIMQEYFRSTWFQFKRRKRSKSIFRIWGNQFFGSLMCGGLFLEYFIVNVISQWHKITISYTDIYGSTDNKKLCWWSTTFRRWGSVTILWNVFLVQTVVVYWENWLLNTTVSTGVSTGTFSLK